MIDCNQKKKSDFVRNVRTESCGSQYRMRSTRFASKTEILPRCRIEEPLLVSQVRLALQNLWKQSHTRWFAEFPSTRAFVRTLTNRVLVLPSECQAALAKLETSKGSNGCLAIAEAKSAFGVHYNCVLCFSDENSNHKNTLVDK